MRPARRQPFWRGFVEYLHSPIWRSVRVFFMLTLRTGLPVVNRSHRETVEDQYANKTLSGGGFGQRHLLNLPPGGELRQCRRRLLPRDRLRRRLQLRPRLHERRCGFG